MTTNADLGAPWTRDDVQRVLYNLVRANEQVQTLGGDSEFLRDALRIARKTLADNGHWPPPNDGSRT